MVSELTGCVRKWAGNAGMTQVSSISALPWPQPSRPGTILQANSHPTCFAERRAGLLWTVSLSLGNILSWVLPGEIGCNLSRTLEQLSSFHPFHHKALCENMILRKWSLWRWVPGGEWLDVHSQKQKVALFCLAHLVSQESSSPRLS